MNPFNRFRLFHWLFVLVFLAAYFSSDDGELLHVWLGYGLVTILAARTLFALVRAKGFPALLPLFRATRSVQATVSRLLVIALIFAASMTTVTGLVMVDNAQALGIAAVHMVTPAYADSDNVARLFSCEVEELHEIAANTTLLIAVAHVGFLFVFRRRFAINMIPGLGTAHAKGRGGRTPGEVPTSGT